MKKKRRAVSKWAGFGLIQLIIVVGVVAVLAVIAIPAYSAYIIRQYINEGYDASLPAREQLAEAYENGGKLGFPAVARRWNQQAGGKGLMTKRVNSVHISDQGLITITYTKDIPNLNHQVNQLVLMPELMDDGNNQQSSAKTTARRLVWQCGDSSTLDEGFYPNECR